MGAADEPTSVTMLNAESTKVVIDLVPESAQQPPFEVTFDRLTADPATLDSAMPYKMLELWTERRHYVIDTTFTCIEVIDRKTRRTDPTHAVLGARLVGGQRRSGKTVHHVKPFPIVGTEAVFEKRAAAGQQSVQLTSKVLRVALRVRVSTAHST